MQFTDQNSDYTRDQREIVNCAFDEAWGAIKAAHQADRITVDVAQIRASLADAIHNIWTADIDANTLAERAVAHVGLTPRRSESGQLHAA